MPRIIINIKERNKSEAQERRGRRGKKPLGLWSLLLFVFSFLLHGERKYRCSSSDVGDDDCCFRGGEQQSRQQQLQLKKRTHPRRRGGFGYQRCELDEALLIGESSGVVRWGVWEGRSMGRRRRRLTLREGFRFQE